MTVTIAQPWTRGNSGELVGDFELDEYVSGSALALHVVGMSGQRQIIRNLPGFTVSCWKLLAWVEDGSLLKDKS